MYEIKVSVRSLVEFICRTGDITSGSGIFSKDAMQEGALIHRKIQKRMVDGYKSEVPLKIEIQKKEFRLVLEGRADGILTEDDKVTIDEIKGVYKPLKYIEEPIYVHKAQAMCYAYMYAVKQNLLEITVQMTYCNLHTEKIKRFSETIDFSSLKKWFDNLTEDYCKWCQLEVDNRKKRDWSIAKLKFPYAYRAGQKDMAGMIYLSIKKGRNLFVQAPTGIGKTMAALFPAIKAMGEGCGRKIFYLTAKTIGREVAKDGLELLRKQGLYFCSVLLTAKEKICMLEHVQCEPETCPYAKGHFDRINDAMYDCLTNEMNITREVLLEYAQKHRVCPFELGLDVSLYADGIVCDYNYVFDPVAKLKRFFLEGTKGEYIFLVDEAHNMVNRASDMYSAALYKEDFLQMKKWLLAYEEDIGNVLNSCNRELLALKRQCVGEQGYMLVADMKSLYRKLLRLQTMMERLMADERDRMVADEHKEEILTFYFQLARFNETYEQLDESYEIYAEQVTQLLFMLRLYCIQPASNLAKCLEQGYSTIFFSATMLPISYYKELLQGTQEQDAIYIASPFSQKKRAIFAGVDVSSRYRMRGPLQYEKMARYLDILVNSKRGNYMAFFPSYKMLNDVYEQARAMHLLSGTEVLLQSADMTETERENFLKAFRSQDKTVIGFCILGGIFSEGIDLTGDSLIGAAVIGTGLPMVCNEREIQQKFFDKKEKNGFAYAYLYPGMNKVQQAAGRVIRTMEDKGVILLLDERFALSQVVETFPQEWEDYRLVTLQSVEREIRTFWERQQ